MWPSRTARPIHPSGPSDKPSFCGIVRECPAHFSQCDRLPGEPLAQAAPRFLINPMLRLGDGLAVQFEKQIGMARLQELRSKILMAGDTGIGAHVEIAQIAHAGGHPCVVSPVGARVSAKPASGGPVAAFTGNTFVRMRGSGQPAGRDGLEWGMARSAARARLRRRYSEALGDSFRPRIEQDRMRLGVKILLAPGDVLAALRPGAAVAAGRFAADRSDKGAAAFTDLPRFSCEKTGQPRGEKEADADDSQQHAEKLSTGISENATANRMRILCPLRGQHEAENRHVTLKDESTESPSTNETRPKSVRPGLPLLPQRLDVAIDIHLSQSIDATLHDVGGIFVLASHRLKSGQRNGSVRMLRSTFPRGDFASTSFSAELDE